MNVSADIAAVQQRIVEIDGLHRAPPAGSPSLATVANGATRVFGSLVAGEIDRLVRASAAGAGVDPALVAAVAQIESGFDPRARSLAGAAGLMQLMPATARALGVADPYDPAQNVHGGASYLGQLLKRFHGNIPLAVAAYNAGPGAVERYGGVPPYAETQSYVGRVLFAYRARSR